MVTETHRQTHKQTPVKTYSLAFVEIIISHTNASVASDSTAETADVVAVGRLAAVVGV